MARKQKNHRRERSRLGKLFQFLAIVAVIAAPPVLRLGRKLWKKAKKKKHKA